MNLLVFSSGFPPIKGGIEIFVYNICRHLVNQGHSVRVLTKGIKEDNDFDKQQRFSISRYKDVFIFSSIPAIFKMLHLLLTEKI